MANERGLFLQVMASGVRYWHMKYRRPAKRAENLLALGVYPDVSLKQARERREQARRLLAEGIDPGEKRQADRIAQRQAAADSLATSDAVSMLAPPLSHVPLPCTPDLREGNMYPQTSGEVAANKKPAGMRVSGFCGMLEYVRMVARGGIEPPTSAL